jgi:MFS family permease
VTVPDARTATYREVFAVGEFRALFAGFGTLIIGDSVRMLGLSVLVYASTGSPLLAALAYVSGFLPNAVGGSILLALADRWRPRTLIVGYDLLRLGVAVVLAVGVLPPLGMVALVFAAGTFAPVAMAARTALLPDLLDGDAYVLGRSLFTIASGGTQIIGFAAGGLLLTFVGPQGALWLAAVTCAVAVGLAWFGLADRPARRAARTGAVRETWRVNRQLLGDRRVRGLLLAQWLPGALMVGAEGVVVPYASTLGDPSAAGVLLMAAAIGMLTGDLVVGRFVRPGRREASTPWLAALLGVPLLGFVLTPAPALAAALLAAATFGFAYHLGLARRFLAAVPEVSRGQAFGLASTGIMTLQGLAVAGAGALGEFAAPGVVMAVAGLASLVATVALWNQLAPSHERDASGSATGRINLTGAGLDA